MASNSQGGNAFDRSLERVNSVETNNRRVEPGMKTNKMFANKGVGGNPTSGGGINRSTKPTSQK
jgi:hypothetical protein